MPGLTIPERFRVGIAAVGSLPEEAFTEFINALKTAAPSETADALAAQIEKEVPSVSHTTVAKMISALAAMQAVQRAAHVEANTFSSDVWDSLVEDASALVKDIDADTLKARVAKFVSETDVHLITSKISQLRSEVERSFCGARILTDIRSAFLDDAAKRPPAMTILHTLEINYHDDSGRHREFYVALDDNDLIILKEAIERAEKKKQNLKELLTKADFQLFE